jgi:hypothetical protein
MTPNLRPVIFVLTPVDAAFDEIYAFVRAACREAEVDCERVEQTIFDEINLARIYHRIGAADLIVSDLSGQDPIVFYETGWAHALGKIVILLARDGADIPFDRQRYPHIVYGDHPADLKTELARRLRWFLDQQASGEPRM